MEMKPHNKAYLQATVYVVLVIIISVIAGIAGVGRDFPFWEEAFLYPFKGIFIFGMLGSVFAQTAVVGFLEHNNLFDGYKIPYEGFVNKPANIVLAILAMFSITLIRYPVWHMVFTLLYLGLVVLLDYWVAKHAENAIGTNGAGENAKLCHEICRSMLSKVDLISLGCVLALALAALVLSGSHALMEVSHQLIKVRASLSGEGSDAVAQLTRIIATLDDAAGKLPDIFLSGAVGFHLLMTLALIRSFINDWRERVISLTSRQTT